MKKLITTLAVLIFSLNSQAENLKTIVSPELYNIAINQLLEINSVHATVGGTSLNDLKVNVTIPNGFVYLGLNANQEIPVELGELSSMLALINPSAVKVGRIVSGKISLTLDDGGFVATVPVTTVNNEPAVTLVVPLLKPVINISNFSVKIKIIPFFSARGLEFKIEEPQIIGSIETSGFPILFSDAAIKQLSTGIISSVIKNTLTDYLSREEIKNAILSGVELYGNLKAGRHDEKAVGISVSKTGISLEFR